MVKKVFKNWPNAWKKSARVPRKMSVWDKLLSYLGISAYNTKKVLPLAQKTVQKLDGIKKQQVLSSLLSLGKQDCSKKTRHKQTSYIVNLVKTEGGNKIPTTYEEAKKLLEAEISEQKHKQVPFRDDPPAYAYITAKLKDAIDFNPLATAAGGDVTTSFLKGVMTKLKSSKNLSEIKKIAKDLLPCAQAFDFKGESESIFQKKVVLNIFFLRSISPLCQSAKEIISPIQKIVNSYCFPREGQPPIPENIKKILDELASQLTT